MCESLSAYYAVLHSILIILLLPGCGRAREGGIFGLEEFLEAKAISGWDSTQDIAAE